MQKIWTVSSSEKDPLLLYLHRLSLESQIWALANCSWVCNLFLYKIARMFFPFSFSVWFEFFLNHYFSAQTSLSNTNKTVRNSTWIDLVVKSSDEFCITRFAGESLCVQQYRNLSSKPQEWEWKIHREAIGWGRKVWAPFFCMSNRKVGWQLCPWAQMHKCTSALWYLSLFMDCSIDILLRRGIVDWMVGEWKWSSGL